MTSFEIRASLIRPPSFNVLGRGNHLVARWGSGLTLAAMPKPHVFIRRFHTLSSSKATRVRGRFIGGPSEINYRVRSVRRAASGCGLSTTLLHLREHEAIADLD